MLTSIIYSLNIDMMRHRLSNKLEEMNLKGNKVIFQLMP